MYGVDDPYTIILEGDYLNENGDRLSIRLDPERMMEGQCLLSFNDRENKYAIENLEGINEEYSFLLYDSYGSDNAGYNLYVSFYVAFAEDFSKVYVLQSGYPYKNYAGVYVREGEMPMISKEDAAEN